VRGPDFFNHYTPCRSGDIESSSLDGSLPSAARLNHGSEAWKTLSLECFLFAAPWLPPHPAWPASRPPVLVLNVYGTRYHIEK